jgi:hypothetical protein
VLRIGFELATADKASDTNIGGFYLFTGFAGKNREPTSGLEPLTCSSYE